jgi:hypothetical protein
MIYVNPNWTYRESVEHIRTLKDEYQRGISSFSMWQKREWANFIVEARKQFYSLKLKEWQIENLWNYMNNNFPYNYLIRSAKRFK